MAWLMAAGVAGAQLPSPQLFTVFPAGAKAGNQVGVMLTGADLEGVALKFAHAGITAKPDAKDTKKQEVTVATDVPAGLYEVWAVGTYGSSNSRLFQVGALPEILSTGKNSTREVAQEVAWPCVVNGTVASQGEQWFKVAVKKGQSLVVNCRAEELDSKLVPVLTMFDMNGRQLANVPKLGTLPWDAAADGFLLVRLGDFLFKGGAEYFYRLEFLATAPQPRVPALLWSLPAVTGKEKEPNDPVHAAAIALPCELGGGFAPARDADAFTFDAKKGEVWWMEVTSQRLGLPTDPRLVVQKLEGDKAVDVLEVNDGPVMSGAPDFDANHRDPIGRFEAKEDGRYRVTLRDLNNTGLVSVERRYQLSIRREAPDFAPIAVAVPAKDNTAGKDFNGPNITLTGNNVRPGQTIPIRVLVLRRDGFQGAVRLRAEGLPAGVTSSESVVSGEGQDTMVFLTASASAEPWTGAIQVVGTAEVGGKVLRHEARGATTLWNLTNDFVEPARSRLSQQIVLSVVKDLPSFPLTIKAVESLSSAVNGKAKMGLTIQRTGEVKDALKLKPMGIPGLDKMKELDIPAGAEKAEYELDLPPLKLKPGVYTLWFKGTVKARLPIKGESKEVTPNVYSTPVVLTVE